jgi:reactive intermediate/imine deaminase
MRTISTTLAPKPAGHYSQAVVQGGLVFVSGLVPIDTETREAPEGIEPQTRLVLQHLKSVLHEAGSALDRVVKVTVYMVRLDDWGEINRICAEVFGDHRPARAIVPISPLAKNYLLEVEAVAAVEGE